MRRIKHGSHIPVTRRLHTPPFGAERSTHEYILWSLFLCLPRICCVVFNVRLCLSESDLRSTNNHTSNRCVCRCSNLSKQLHCPDAIKGSHGRNYAAAGL